jgi:hypothetical protein
VKDGRAFVKQVLGKLPITAEAFQLFTSNGGFPSGGYSLEKLQAVLPSWTECALKARDSSSRLPSRRVLVVGYLRWWLEYATALAVLLAGRGCQVDLAFVPYRKWIEPVNDFDKRRQSSYIRRILAPTRELLRVHDLSKPVSGRLPSSLTAEIERLSRSDVQYTTQREMLDLSTAGPDAALYALRLERNKAAAGAALRLIQRNKHDVVVIPNGSILEFGAIFRSSWAASAAAVTFEFGEQRERMWLAQNAEVMRQDSSSMWEARGALELSDAERDALEQMYVARRAGNRWANFAREWQAAPSRGARAAAEELGLDTSQPVALLCTNVVGDSLALNRQIFSDGMTDWLVATVRHLAESGAGQLVVRVHPGEMLGAGPPSAEVLRDALPTLPEHVRVVTADSELNTYDLIELADVGLVYTSTVGLEMAMAGVPVLVAGLTHYRSKGFTRDPRSLSEYLQLLDQVLSSPESHRLDDTARQLAARYAYRFFFEYPFRFPWHLSSFWDDIEERSMESVLNDEAVYENTLRALIGEPIDWTAMAGARAQA